MRGWGPKFLNVGRAQLNSQNFCRFLNQSWRTPTAMTQGDGCNRGVDVKVESDDILPKLRFGSETEMAKFPINVCSTLESRHRYGQLTCQSAISTDCRTLLGSRAYPVTISSILVPSDCSLILSRCRFPSCAVRNHPVADLLPLSTLKPSC